MATFFGKRMYGKNTVHMDKQTLTVRMERFVSDEGADDIPHRIATGMALARRMVDSALAQITVKNYMEPKSRLAAVDLMVYRRRLQALVGQGTEEQRRKAGEKAVKEALVDLQGRLQKLQSGLGKDQVIKVSNKTTRNSKNEVGHYLGLVKNVQTGDRREWGHIEVGYETFRRGAWLPRVLLHEAAHKYCDANDGPETGGYWTKDFADYLKPEVMDTTACLNNADSHALFIWALSHPCLAEVPWVSAQFEERLSARAGLS